MKVRVNSTYIYNPVMMDVCSPSHMGLVKGDVVKVVNKFGCPPANTMGQCYVEKGGLFMGMVCCNSLEKV